MKSFNKSIINLTIYISIAILSVIIIVTSLTLQIIKWSDSDSKDEIEVVTPDYDSVVRPSYLKESFFDKILGEHFDEYFYWEKWGSTEDGYDVPELSEDETIPTSFEEWIEFSIKYHLSFVVNMIDEYLDVDYMKEWEVVNSTMEELDEEDIVIEPFQLFYFNPEETLRLEDKGRIQDSIIIANDINLVGSPVVDEGELVDSNTLRIDNSIIVIEESIYDVARDSEYFDQIKITNSLIYSSEKATSQQNDDPVSPGSIMMKDSIILGEGPIDGYSLYDDSMDGFHNNQIDDLNNDEYIDNCYFDNYYVHFEEIMAEM